MNSLSGWTRQELTALNQAQSGNAKLYRRMARRAPWNSKTRQGWRDLALAAERLAKCARIQCCDL